MSFSDLLYIIAFVSVIWYWMDAMRCKEIAHYAGKTACVEAGVLFLDDSVTINKVRLKRNELGQMVFYRQYYFEFTGNGDQRSHGEVKMLRHRVIETTMDAYRI